MVQAFLRKWWFESDFKAPNLPLSLRMRIYFEIFFEILNHVWWHFQLSNILWLSLGIDRWIRNSSDSNACKSRATRLMPLVEQELLVLSKFIHAVSNAQSLVFCLMLSWSLFVFFFFDHYIALHWSCAYSIYGFWRFLWYLQSFPK